MHRVKISDDFNEDKPESDSAQYVSITAVVILACAWCTALRVNAHANVRRIEENIVVLEDFYQFPQALRSMALLLFEWKPHRALYKSLSGTPLESCLHHQRTLFSEIIAEALDKGDWEHAVAKTSNGWIQLIHENASPTVHHDALTRFGGVVYLTPNPPEESGTSFYTHIETNVSKYPSVDEASRMSEEEQVRLQAHEKKDIWKEHEPSRLDCWRERVTVENVFNRLVLFDSQLFHKAQRGFGTTAHDARMYQTFFFGRRDSDPPHGSLKHINTELYRRIAKKTRGDLMHKKNMARF